MPSSGMLCHVVVVRTDGPVTANLSSPILVTPMMEAIRSSETSVLTGATWYNIPEDDILQNEIHPATFSV
jgi:hypothetical protein